MDEKGQGALEYLLLIGGAVLVAVVVIVLVLQLSSSPKEFAQHTVSHYISNLQSQV